MLIPLWKQMKIGVKAMILKCGRAISAVSPWFKARGEKRITLADHALIIITSISWTTALLCFTLHPVLCLSL